MQKESNSIKLILSLILTFSFLNSTFAQAKREGNLFSVSCRQNYLEDKEGGFQQAQTLNDSANIYHRSMKSYRASRCKKKSLGSLPQLYVLYQDNNKKCIVEKEENKIFRR